MPLQLTPEQDAALRAIGELHAVPLESFATVINFEHAWELLGRLQSYPLKEPQWAFRGHSNATWPLQPTIERLGKSYSDTFRSGAEEYVRRTFKRRAHHYLHYLPDERDELEWMALMRHHGAPTRLLDWSRSPYVAAFFALAEAKDEVSAIWAVDVSAIRVEALALLNQSGSIPDPMSPDFSFSDPVVFSQVFLGKTYPSVVAPVQPLKMNDRATSQQSLFLCTNDTMWGFEFALKQVLSSDREKIQEWSRKEHPQDEPLKVERLFKLCIAPDARSEILRELHRMNINYATLFPGLDGFARSLGTNITVSGFKNFSFGSPDFDSRV